MPRLVITIHNRSRIPLAKFYMLVKEAVDYFGLESDVTCELEDS